MDEPAEDAEAYTDASDVGDYEHYCIAVAFEFVHGFGLVRQMVEQVADHSCQGVRLGQNHDQNRSIKIFHGA